MKGTHVVIGLDGCGCGAHARHVEERIVIFCRLREASEGVDSICAIDRLYDFEMAACEAAYAQQFDACQRRGRRWGSPGGRGG